MRYSTSDLRSSHHISISHFLFSTINSELHQLLHLHERQTSSRKNYWWKEQRSDSKPCSEASDSSFESGISSCSLVVVAAGAKCTADQYSVGWRLDPLLLNAELLTCTIHQAFTLDIDCTRVKMALAASELAFASERTWFAG